MSCKGTVRISDDIVLFDRYGGSSWGMAEMVAAVANAREEVLASMKDSDPGFVSAVADLLEKRINADQLIARGDEAQALEDAALCAIDAYVTESPELTPCSFFDRTDLSDLPDEEGRYYRDSPTLPLSATKTLSWDEAREISAILENLSEESRYYASPYEENVILCLSA